MSSPYLIPAVASAAVLATGAAIGGAFIGQGVENARIGDRSVTVRGLSEREVKADLAVLPLRFTASGDVLSDVQARIDGDLVLVRRFLAAQGYPTEAVDLGRLEAGGRGIVKTGAFDIYMYSLLNWGHVPRGSAHVPEPRGVARKSKGE